MAQESEGVVDNRNPHSTARGLFQLLEMTYHYDPHGEKSFGNATEECQGGIRYIKDRYKTAKKARAFWLEHHRY
jgi:SLT domain-containing protein